jgi:hypothetical protein
MMSRRTALPVGLLCVVLVLAGSATGASAATVEQSMQAALLKSVNASRAELGLRPLRPDSKLGSLAVRRARWMAQRGELSHETFGGSIDTAVKTTGIPWLSAGENVAWASGVAGAAAAQTLFDAWRASPSHWAAITSDTFNYVGVGVALTSSGAETYAALVFVETLDRTAPVARLKPDGVSGRTVTWIWTATDPLLQTHSSRVCNFDVGYRVDSGAWRDLKSRTTTTVLTLTNRTSGRTYTLRVRARDCAGNVSAWKVARAVKVP